MAESRQPAYRRVLLKISGEALMGQGTSSINPEVITLIATEIADIANLKVRRFVRFKLGEGIEKKSTDFAAEVAAMTQG